MAQESSLMHPRPALATTLNVLTNLSGHSILFVLATVLLSITFLLLHRRKRYRRSHHSHTSDLETDCKSTFELSRTKGRSLTPVIDLPPPLRSIYKHETVTSIRAPVCDEVVTRRHSYPLATAASVKLDVVDFFAAELDGMEEAHEKPMELIPEIWRRRTLVFEQ